MPGESLQRDLSEVLEFYGEDKRRKLHAAVLANYLIACLNALTQAVFIGGLVPARNAEAGAHGQPETVDAQTLSFLEVGSDDPEG